MDQKCARYWPHANEVEEFGQFYVRNLSESNVKTENGKAVDDLIERWLELRCGRIISSYILLILNFFVKKPDMTLQHEVIENYFDSRCYWCRTYNKPVSVLGLVRIRSSYFYELNFSSYQRDTQDN